MSHVLEVVVFKLNEGADEANFLEDAQATFDLLEGYDGFISRELTKTEDGTWIDVVTWANMDVAMQAAEAIMGEAVGQKFGSHINFESTQMMHTEPKISLTKVKTS